MRNGGARPRTGASGRRIPARAAARRAYAGPDGCHGSRGVESRARNRDAVSNSTATNPAATRHCMPMPVSNDANNVACPATHEAE